MAEGGKIMKKMINNTYLSHVAIIMIIALIWTALPVSVFAQTAREETLGALKPEFPAEPKAEKKTEKDTDYSAWDQPQKKQEPDSSEKEGQTDYAQMSPIKIGVQSKTATKQDRQETQTEKQTINQINSRNKEVLRIIIRTDQEQAIDTVDVYKINSLIATMQNDPDLVALVLGTGNEGKMKKKCYFNSDMTYYSQKTQIENSIKVKNAQVCHNIMSVHQAVMVQQKLVTQIEPYRVWVIEYPEFILQENENIPRQQTIIWLVNKDKLIDQKTQTLSHKLVTGLDISCPECTGNRLNLTHPQKNLTLKLAKINNIVMMRVNSDQVNYLSAQTVQSNGKIIKWMEDNKIMSAIGIGLIILGGGAAICTESKVNSSGPSVSNRCW